MRFHHKKGGQRNSHAFKVHRKRKKPANIFNQLKNQQQSLQIRIENGK